MNKMRIICFGVRAYEIPIIKKIEQENNIQMELSESYLNDDNIDLAVGFEVIIIRANCYIKKESLAFLKEKGLKYLLTRTVGFDHIDIESCKELDIKTAYAPGYSPESIAELNLALAISLLRNIPESAVNACNNNFTLNDRMFGKTISSCTVGIIGCGRIGTKTAEIYSKMGAKVYGYDLYKSDSLSQYFDYVDLDVLLKKSDIISINMSYNKMSNYHFLDRSKFKIMKKNCIVINTARGELINTNDLIESIENGTIYGAGLDVIENEKNVFFKKHLQSDIDPVLKRLIDLFPKVVITPHISSSTYSAVYEALSITINNLNEYIKTGNCKYSLY